MYVTNVGNFVERLTKGSGRVESASVTAILSEDAISRIAGRFLELFATKFGVAMITS